MDDLDEQVGVSFPIVLWEIEGECEHKCLVEKNGEVPRSCEAHQNERRQIENVLSGWVSFLLIKVKQE